MTRFLSLLLALTFTTSVAAQNKQTSKVLPNVLPVVEDFLYAAETEVTNMQYRNYLQAIKKQSATAWEAAYPDTTVWISSESWSYGDPHTKTYFWHPAYDNYPVVGVSHDQAKNYCAWLTTKLNTMAAECEGPTNYVEVRLPTAQEWEAAALSGLPEGSIFPWEGKAMRNPEKKHLGNFMANFALDNMGNQGIATAENVYLYGTSPVFAYFPNKIGLYNMAGNVAEMLDQPGQTKGGSWRTTGAYLQVKGDDPHQGWTRSSSDIGFRYFLEIIEFPAKPPKKAETLSAELVEGWMLSISETDDLFAGRTEVTNGMYKYFLSSIKVSDPEAWEKHQIQHDGWYEHTAYVSKRQYGLLPQFDNYPVVNIGYESAVAFCDWLTETYASFEDREFDHAAFKLPSKTEWETAARGGMQGPVAYPWGGPYICNARGCFLCNFNPQELRFLKTDADGKNYYDYPNGDISISRGLDGRTWLGTATDYSPNDYGLYNCAGNAAEMVAEKGVSKGGSWTSTSYFVQISTDDSYTGPNASLGFRIFMTDVDTQSASR